MDKYFEKLINEIRIKSKLYKFDVEPTEIIYNVYLLRKFWKPKKIKILLLAESHVWTELKEYKTTINNISNLNLDENYPTNYSKFVYCLGYGENHILKKKIDRNNGTPQFWKLFYGLFYDLSKENKVNVAKTYIKDADVRISNKINLLNRMKEKGVWLLDASPIALYRNGEKPNINFYKEVLDLSWKYYLKPYIEKERPDKIIIVGKQVYDTLEYNFIESKLNNIEWIYQPQGVRSKEAIKNNYKKLFSIASKII